MPLLEHLLRHQWWSHARLKACTDRMFRVGMSHSARYKFGNQWLLRLALLHTSAYPHTGSGNLAWLGDSALYLVVSEQLAATYSNAAMGDLTFARARLVSGELCAEWVTLLPCCVFLRMSLALSFGHMMYVLQAQ